VKVAERVALVERIARSAAWRGLKEEEREALRAEATELVDEIEGSHRGAMAVGGMFLDPSTDPEPAE
jgi:hypothetical protein